MENYLDWNIHTTRSSWLGWRGGGGKGRESNVELLLLQLQQLQDRLEQVSDIELHLLLNNSLLVVELFL